MNELAPGSMSLEEEETRGETPPPAAEAPPPAPEAPQQTAPAEDADPDGTIEGSGGVKFVPLGAVVDLRGKVREKDTELAAAKAELEQLKGTKAELEQIKGAWNTVQPLIQQFKSQQQSQKPTISDEALQYAKDLDLYKADGTPDGERAQRILDRTTALAQEQAKAIVQPLYQNTAHEKSLANFEQAATFKHQTGVQADRAILQDLWSKVPPEMSAQPGVASVLWRVAIAETLMAGKTKPPTAAPPPPQHTESPGGGATVPRELTAIDKAMMTAGNIKTKDYEEISARFKPGHVNSLE